MVEVALVALNARYAHTSFGARYLLANLEGVEAELIEFDLQVQPRSAVEKILALNPKVVGLGCYIWNIELATKVAALLKLVRPEIKLLLGGPEISFETEQQEIFQYADHVICGEGEVAFRELCLALLGRRDACGTGEGSRDACGTGESSRAACDTSVVPQASRLLQSTGFNPHEPVQQSRRKNLPHWTQVGCTYFVTFRLADSIAQSRIHEYEELRAKWEEHHHPPYSEQEREQFEVLFSERVNGWLDEGAGSCCLRRTEISQIVADALTHFDGERYVLDEWVVMPNHIHVLVQPLEGFALKDILHSWKSFSAHAINKALGTSGAVWQRESYDHIVRDLDELERIRGYIRKNPEKAGIRVVHAGSRRDACDTGRSRRDACGTGEGSRDGCDTSVVPQASRLPRIIRAEPVDVTRIRMPYGLYSEADITHRAIYVEASRGCPFGCEYCMSSLDSGVRYFPEEPFFAAMDGLLERGAKVFKFVDRTFNLRIDFALRVLRFFRERYVPGMMLHFEMIPDRLPEELVAEIEACPAGMLQFEIGIQTFDETVANRIKRPLDLARIETNMRRLSAMEQVHIHADLIAGLPGEDLAGFAAGFDRLLALEPHEIQLGILKRLRGAPIARHTAEWGMVYSPHAPYELVQSDLIPFEQMQRVQRFARFWNLTVNNGQFVLTAPMLWQGADSAFSAFMVWSTWLYGKVRTTGNIALLRLAKLLMEFLVQVCGRDEREVAYALWRDYRRGNRPDEPGFLKRFGFEAEADSSSCSLRDAALPPRQARHGRGDG